MSTFPQVTSPPQASAEVLVNRMGETLEHQAVYGLKHSTTTALTWGYYGGRWGGFSITDDTLTLTDASANYVVVAIATGVISVATASTNWDNDTDYVRVYKITTAAGVVTAVEDHRAGPGGVHGGAGGGGGGGTAARSPSIQSVTSSATVTPTFADDMVKITAQAAGLTLANPSGTPIPGLGIVIRIKDNGTARAISYDTQYRAIGVTLPTTTVISKTLYLAMIFNGDDTKWDVVAVGQQA